MNSVGAATKMQVLRLLARNVLLCLPLSSVNKVLPLVMLEKVPNCPPFVVGLMNLSGRSVTVVDLAVRLGMERTEAYTLETPLILCSREEQELALLVDHIIGLAEIEEKDLQISCGSPFLGSIVFEKNVFQLLDPDQLLNLNARPVLEDRVHEH